MASINPKIDAAKVLDRIAVITGVEGPCIAINDLRVAGPKPWGGGKTLAEWSVDRNTLLRALSMLPKEDS